MTPYHHQDGIHGNRGLRQRRKRRNSPKSHAGNRKGLDDRMRRVMSLVAILSTAGGMHANATVDLHCEPALDQCPQQFDGVCNRGIIAGCETGDCFDCDPCRVHDFDCGGCAQQDGCRWCPGDSMCSSVGHRIDLGNFISTSCPLASDWHESCEDENHSHDHDHHDNVFSDPQYDEQQWVFDMINVETVWRQGIYGNDINIRINDAGVDFDHPEFAGRADIANSCENYLPSQRNGQHGTTVASIMAAGRGNGHCAVGIAPATTLSSCDVITDRKSFGYKPDSMEISQNSWGISACKAKQENRRDLESAAVQNTCPFLPDAPSTPCDKCDFSERPVPNNCEDAITAYCKIRTNYEQDSGCVEFLELFAQCSYNTLSPHDQDVLNNGITKGRDGKGILYVFAAGNTFHVGDDTNFLGLVNSRFTISVGSVGRDGKHAAYSTSGAALLVTAPGGDSEDASHQLVAQAGGGCRNSGQGTSFSAPIVSGVLALILEANPTLTWRDVQGIIAATSTGVFDPTDASLKRNAAGFVHSNLYGFGIINAGAAVNAAKGWQNFGPEELIMKTSIQSNIPIPDDGTPIETFAVVSRQWDMVAESVVLYLDITHSTRGDLRIVLTSPSGTESVLHPGFRPENNQLGDGEKLKLMTVRNWGEEVNGDWTLTVSDENPGDLQECVDFGSTFQSGTLRFQCDDIARLTTTLCEDGKVVHDGAHGITSVDGGKSLAESCCECGGGRHSSQVPNVLVSWKLMIYAHKDVAPITEQPTQSPTLKPSRFPTTTPTKSPTNRPTRSPTPRPTLLPTSTPTTRMPTQLPTSLASIVTESSVPSASGGDGDDGDIDENVPTPVPSQYNTPETLKPISGVNFDTPFAQQQTDPPSQERSSNIFDVQSDAPSMWPTNSSSPSLVPTLSPTLRPSSSSEPSEIPSEIPSLSPTETSSTVPSASPSLQPSIEPSTIPSRFPSSAPTDVPTVAVSNSPSEAASGAEGRSSRSTIDHHVWMNLGIAIAIYSCVCVLL